MAWEIILLFKMTRTVLKLVRWFSLKFVHVNGRQSEYIPGISFLITGKEGGGSYYQITFSRTLTFQLRNS